MWGGLTFPHLAWPLPCLSSRLVCLSYRGNLSLCPPADRRRMDGVTPCGLHSGCANPVHAVPSANPAHPVHPRFSLSHPTWAVHFWPHFNAMQPLHETILTLDSADPLLHTAQPPLRTRMLPVCVLHLSACRPGLPLSADAHPHARPGQRRQDHHLVQAAYRGGIPPTHSAHQRPPPFWSLLNAPAPQLGCRCTGVPHLQHLCTAQLCLCLANVLLACWSGDQYNSNSGLQCGDHQAQEHRLHSVGLGRADHHTALLEVPSWPRLDSRASPGRECGPCILFLSEHS